MPDKIKSPPKIIYLTGVDGSGKSFFAAKLEKHFADQGLRVAHLWLRFSNLISKPVLGLARLMGLNYYEVHGTTKVGYHDFERSRFISFFFIVSQILDVWLVTLFKLWPCTWKHDVVVCDRGAFDTIIDVAIDTKRPELIRNFTGKLFTALLPASYVVILINRPPDKIFSTRPDVKFDRNFALRQKLYAEAAEKFGWVVVENDGTIEETFSKLLKKIS